ncbi:hypothetical protein EDC94DRAFT_170415 [Helicostylum pulchrum]|nr:hypothetical protein EDC94DRAFT_170415 [Helicostylum pulchrum]
MTAPNVNWPSIENNLILNIPISQQSLYPSHNMMDNQQVQMAMMMQQQQQQQLQQLQLQQQQHQQLLQQQQEYMLLNQQPWFLQQQQQKNSIQSASSVSSPLLVSMTPPAGAREPDMILMKRVEVILTINQELIRLCLEHQQMNMYETREPDITM